jgi:peptide/nickel transport system permease protein
MTGRTVREELAERLPVTMLLSVLALVMAIVVAAPAGVIMATRAGKRMDRAVGGALLTLWSVPMVVMATLLLGFTARGGLGLQWFPPGGMGEGSLETLWHLTLPATSLAIVACAPLAKQFRAALLEQLNQEFVQTAIAKGLSAGKVIRQHIVRASLGPLVTVLGGLVPTLGAGSVLIESVFSIDGMGMLAWRSAVNHDLDVVLAIALITALAHMVALLLADVVYMLIDPRVRFVGRQRGGAA